MSELVDTELGFLPKEWKVLKVDTIKKNEKGSIAMGPFGSDIKTDNFVDKGVPIIRGGNLNDFIFHDYDFVYLTDEKADSLKNSICYPGDIIFTHRGTIGQVGIIPQNSNFKRYVVSQSGMKLTVNEDIVSPEFVHLFFKSRVGQYILLRNKSQVGVPAIGQPTTSLKEMIVPIPPKEESDEIAKTILSIQNKITLLREQNQTLEELAQTLFKRWFVDFEFPNENGQPYKSSGGNMIDCELGEIPEGWRVGCIVDLTSKMASGGTPSTKNEEFYKGYINWFSTKELQDNFLLTSEKQISNDAINNSSAKLFPKNTVLMAIYAAPTVGRLGVLSIEGAFNQAAVGLVAKEEVGYPFIFLMLKHLRKELNSLANGAAQQNLNVGLVKNFKIIIPEVSVLECFKGLSLSIFRQIENKTTEIQSLTQLRDTLLSKLMSGEIRVNQEAV